MTQHESASGSSTSYVPATRKGRADDDASPGPLDELLARADRLIQGWLDDNPTALGRAEPIRAIGDLAAALHSQITETERQHVIARESWEFMRSQVDERDQKIRGLRVALRDATTAESCSHANTTWTMGGPEDSDGYAICTDCGQGLGDGSDDITREQVRAVIASREAPEDDPGDRWLVEKPGDRDCTIWDLDVEALADAVWALLQGEGQ